MLNSWDHNFTLLPAICLWKSSCIKNNERKTQNWKLLRRFDNPTHNNFTGWYNTNCHEMIQCFGIKKCIYIYIYTHTRNFQTTQHRDLSWNITCDDTHTCRLCILNNLPVVWKHPNIVLLMSHFFPPIWLLSEVNLKQYAVESGVTVGVRLMHYKAREVTSL